jgi:hypothetical protein
MTYEGKKRENELAPLTVSVISALQMTKKKRKDFSIFI